MRDRRCGIRPCAVGWVVAEFSGPSLTRVALAVHARTAKATAAAWQPEALLEPSGSALSGLIAYIDAPVGPYPGPVHTAGTPFQQRVWQALQAVDCGTVVTYGELARRLGAPQGARAVARAVAANPLAVVVPCHRVVLATGGLGGYRWGQALKERLLARERAAWQANDWAEPVQ